MTLRFILVRRDVIMLVVWIISAFLLEAGAKQAPREEYAEYWKKSGQERLRFEIQRQKEEAKFREKVAKNVIIFLGDGMGISTITAARIYKNQRAGGYGEEKALSFEEFPYIGLSKTYEVDFQVIRH